MWYMRNDIVYKILAITILCLGCSKIEPDQTQVIEQTIHIYEQSEVVKINGACIVVFTGYKTLAAVTIPCNE